MNLSDGKAWEDEYGQNSQNNIIKYKYLYVMDFSNASISEIELTEEDKNLIDCDILDKYCFNDSECSWMFTIERITNINRVNIFRE